MTTEILTYAGWLSIGYGESDEALKLYDPDGDTPDGPLAELLKEAFAGKQVSVRYWITDERVDRDQAQEAFLRTLFGDIEVEFNAHYSDITGYLWTDEELNIGGHDLLSELKSHKGKWLILEVEVHSS